MSRRRDARGWRTRLATLGIAILCAAPVPGDIGSCGQPVQLLDAPHFFGTKKSIDCRQCRACDFSTEACQGACDPQAPFDTVFPDGCVPLVHDGEVCLRVLLRAGCDDYLGYVSDEAPTAPTECDFCPSEVR